MIAPSVTITIVTFNSGRYIARCLEFVSQVEYPKFDVVIIDNASTDETPHILRAYESRHRIIYNLTNNGFAGGQNQAIALSRSDWVLTLNPDVRLTPGFLARAVAAGDSDESIGSVSGKLLAIAPDFEISSRPVLDSTGIYFTPSLRHFDRGSRDPDLGQYDSAEYVFGVTGAAALYRRGMIDDVSIAGQFFDEDFFAYREDADLAWRAQLLGWKCLYTPHAIAYHVRSVLPTNRSSVAAALNMHSVKNRFLMRIKNVTRGVYLSHFLAITWRDILVFAGCVLREWSSLPAFAFVVRNAARTWAKRRAIMQRRRVSDHYIESWFSNLPAAIPAAHSSAVVSSTERAVSR